MDGLANDIVQAIDEAVVRDSDDGFRPHLGASIIGKPCEREIYYSFRWMKKKAFDGRMLRLFGRGHREEPVFADLLRKTGATVFLENPADGKQFSYSRLGGHYGGSQDGAAKNLPGAYLGWVLLEFKTHNRKSFDKLILNRVEKAKPEHHDQMIQYMAWSGLPRALYCAVCKDDDRIHMEWVEPNENRARALEAKAERIITGQEPPDRLNDEPTWFECKFCDFHSICHGKEIPLPNCRTCCHAEVNTETGAWVCGFTMQDLMKEEQEVGCRRHLYIPKLLENWAEPMDASLPENWVQYQIKGTEHYFKNGPAGDGTQYTSREIHDVEDKTALADPLIAELVRTFEGRLVKSN